MKSKYISPATYTMAAELSEIIAKSGSFDGLYGYEDNGLLPEHGGGTNDGYTQPGTINWRGEDDGIGADDMFSKGYRFGNLWDD